VEINKLLVQMIFSSFSSIASLTKLVVFSHVSTLTDPVALSVLLDYVARHLKKCWVDGETR